MRNRAAERRHFGHFRVYMDELMIAGGVGEFVDHRLIDSQPFGDTDDRTGQCLQFVEGDDSHSAFLTQ